MHDWETLRLEHGPNIWAIIYRIVQNEADALDCYQDVFSEAFVKTKLASIDNLPGFLRWLAVRRALDVRRRQRNRSVREQSYCDATLMASRDLGDPLQFTELVEQVRLQLDDIPLPQAEAFWLCCVEEMTYADAAAAMQLTAGHVGVLVHRARQHLQKALVDWSTQSHGKPNLTNK